MYFFGLLTEGYAAHDKFVRLPLQALLGCGKQVEPNADKPRSGNQSAGEAIFVPGFHFITEISIVSSLSMRQWEQG